MTRTNIELDDELIAEVMRRFGVTTKREAVHLALQRAVGVPANADAVRDLAGIGWDGDLDAMRSGSAPRA